MACPEGKTADGFETQFGTNHLGHFVFVNRLVPLLVAGAPSRIVCLSSSGHRFSDVDLDDPNFERTPYDPWMAYGRSKTANALFAVALDKRLKDRGVRACAVHPGGIQTELGRHLTPETIKRLTDRGVRRRHLPVQDDPPGRRHLRLGGHRRRPERDRRPLLRGLPRRRARHRTRRSRRRPPPRPGPRHRRGPLDEERGASRRKVRPLRPACSPRLHSVN